MAHAGVATRDPAAATARVPWIPIAIITVMVVMALFAPLLAPYSPIDQTLRDKLLPPFWMRAAATSTCSAPTRSGATS